MTTAERRRVAAHSSILMTRVRVASWAGFALAAALAVVVEMFRLGA